QIIYFEIYGTLIDKETGLFNALRPLLERSGRDFDRREWLSFYFESETEMKRRTPSARYSQILADTYNDVSLRLGLTPVQGESLLFVQSIGTWPLFDGVDWFLHCLLTVPSISLVAITDMDHDSFHRTASFIAIASYFREVFTWDSSQTYKPNLEAFAAPLKYHDTLGVRRIFRCIIASSLFEDLEPARDLGLGAIWLRHAGSLASGVHSSGDAFIFATVGSFS
ncbi:HAD-like domain-containing protein, partial [Mycena rebaudengoi]